ncbi:MAG TPA: hypothetical protein VFS84_02815, partial [Candidatus Binatia bacterium]|nr:hypothetical protein [Candidatus Binatia bacterium]
MLYSMCGREVSRDYPRAFLFELKGAENLRVREKVSNEVEKNSPYERLMYTKLLIPLDGSRLAEGVLPYARLLAHGLNVPVELLRV